MAPEVQKRSFSIENERARGQVISQE